MRSTRLESKACWPWSHQWAKWTDKKWSRLVRERPLFATANSTADEPSEIGIECIQERRCERCNMLQLRKEQSWI